MNIPNILTGLRFILVIPFVFFLLQNTITGTIISFFIYIIASITDYFDGYFARKYNQTSKIGAFLDPLADKILVLSAFFIFSLKHYVYLPYFLVILMMFRDYFITVLRLEVDPDSRINLLKIKYRNKETSNTNNKSASTFIKNSTDNNNINYNNNINDNNINRNNNSNNNSNSNNNKSFKTSYAAKFKTAFQMITIVIFYFVYLNKLKLFDLNYGLLKYIPITFFIISIFLTYYSGLRYVLKYKKESFLTLIKTITTFFYLGFLTSFPGTFVSFIFIGILYFMNINVFLLSLIFIILLIIAIITSNVNEKIEKVYDPGYITIDEIIGIIISVFPYFVVYQFLFSKYLINNSNIFSLMYKSKIIYFIISFILFRIFDIFKPFGIKQSQRINGGLGIVVDDFIAGLYVAIIMLIPLLFLL